MLTWEYPPHITTGLAKHVVELVSQLSQKKLHDGPVLVDVLTPRFADAPAVEQVSPTLTIYRIDIPSNDGYSLTSTIPSNALLTEQIDDLVQRRHYDLVHIQGWRFATIGIGIKHQYGLPLIATFHLLERMRHQQSPPDEIIQIENLERDIANEAAQFIVCSQFMRQELRTHLGISNENIQVIANGVKVNTGEECPPEKQNILRQQHAPQEQKLLLFVGSTILEKGLSVLIRAMPHILTDHPGTRLLVAGKQSDQLLPFAYELHVDDAIDFLGYVNDRRRDCLYQTVDAMIIPSLYEPFGMVALEAMALGCNVIASKIGGLGEVVKNMENGLTIHPNDPQSIAEAVNRLFADPAAAQQRRARALDEIHTFYRWDRIAGQTVEAYSGLISAR